MKKGSRLVRLLASLMFAEAAQQNRIMQKLMIMANKKNELLLNINGPIPYRKPNQRQKKKLLRQVPQLRKIK